MKIRLVSILSGMQTGAQNKSLSRIENVSEMQVYMW